MEGKLPAGSTGAGAIAYEVLAGDASLHTPRRSSYDGRTLSNALLIKSLGTNLWLLFLEGENSPSSPTGEHTACSA